jgi:NTE family protein
LSYSGKLIKEEEKKEWEVNCENKQERKKIVLACQGGGAQTAFTAGVLDEILKQYNNPKSEFYKKYEIIGFSGTSGGAICASLAYLELKYNVNGLLKSFWQDMKTKVFPKWDELGNQSFFQLGLVWLTRLTRSIGLNADSLPEYSGEAARKGIEKILKPILKKYPIIYDPAHPLPYLLLGASECVLGRFRVFDSSQENITLDKIIASCAIPHLFKEVIFPAQIVNDQQQYHYYWDGLYSQNPPLRNFLEVDEDSFCLAEEDIQNLLKLKQAKTIKKANKPDEIWIIRINPQEYDQKPPRTHREIADRSNELQGNLSLAQEIYLVKKYNELIAKGKFCPPTDYKLVRVRDDISLKQSVGNYDLDLDSKMDRSSGLIDELYQFGINMTLQVLATPAYTNPCQAIKEIDFYNVCPKYNQQGGGTNGGG